MKASALGLCGKGHWRMPGLLSCEPTRISTFPKSACSPENGKISANWPRISSRARKMQSIGKRNAPFWMPCWTGRMTRLLWQPKCRKKSPRGENSTRPLSRPKTKRKQSAKKWMTCEVPCATRLAPGARPWTQEALPFAISAACQPAWPPKNSFCRNWTTE